MSVSVPTEQHPSPTSLEQVLEPVRGALLADAGAEAARIVEEAARSATEVTGAASAEAEATIERSRRRTELSSRAHSDRVLARLRNDEQRGLHDAQQQLLRRLIETVHVSARQLRADPRYPALLDQLESMARDQLGEEAVIERDPSPDGGVVARAGTHRVDYRLPILAERALDDLSDKVAELWA